MQIECKTMKEMLRKRNMAIKEVASKILFTLSRNVQCLLHIVVGTPPILQKEDDFWVILFL